MADASYMDTEEERGRDEVLEKGDRVDKWKGGGERRRNMNGKAYNRAQKHNLSLAQAFHTSFLTYKRDSCDLFQDQLYSHFTVLRCINHYCFPGKAVHVLGAIGDHTGVLHCMQLPQLLSHSATADFSTACTQPFSRPLASTRLLTCLIPTLPYWLLCINFCTWFISSTLTKLGQQVTREHQ